ncbi:hypothetical protein OIU76_010573 [Salix suchowensis]|nr:hypothetical protein OIU76_010573 [Salix suchowensis]
MDNVEISRRLIPFLEKASKNKASDGFARHIGEREKYWRWIQFGRCPSDELQRHCNSAGWYICRGGLDCDVSDIRHGEDGEYMGQELLRVCSRKVARQWEMKAREFI